MNPNLLLLPSVELTERVYHHLSRWKDYSSFSMVNTHMSKIAFNQISDLVFNIHEEKDITAHLPSKTARIVQVNNSVKITHGFIYLLLKNYAKCKMIKLEINHQMNIQIAEKMCKPLVKNGISLRIENSPQESMLNGLMEIYHKKYSSQYIRYAENIGHPIKKQRILDTQLMEVPKDPIKNHIFFLEKVLELVKNNFNTSNNNNEGIPNGFKKSHRKGC